MAATSHGTVYFQNTGNLIGWSNTSTQANCYLSVVSTPSYSGTDGSIQAQCNYTVSGVRYHAEPTIYGTWNQGTTYFGYALYLPTTWDFSGSQRNVTEQYGTEMNNSVINPDYYQAWVGGGNASGYQFSAITSAGDENSGTMTSGAWHTIVTAVTYGAGGNVTVWFDGSLAWSVDGNISGGGGGNPYGLWAVGLYEADWDGGNEGPQAQRTLYDAAMTIASSYDEANPIPAQFILTSTTTAQSVLAGTAAGANLNIAAQNGFTGAVGFSTLGLPLNTSASFTPSTVTTNGTTAMALTTGTATPSGPYTVLVSATSSSFNDNYFFNIIVNTLPDILVTENQSATQTFSLGNLGSTPAASLQVTATSSNLTLVPATGLAVSGTGLSRTVTITPAASQSGTSRITVNVSNGSTSTAQRFYFAVNPSYTPPSISPIANQIVDEGSSPNPLTISVSDLQTTGTLAVSATSSNTSLLPNSGVSLSYVSSPWTSADLGTVTVNGTTDMGESVTVQASGTDIWNTTDSGRVVYDSMSGDGQIQARVDSVQPVNVWSKAGVMMRTSGSDASCPNAYMLVSASNGVAFQIRSSENASTVQVGGVSGITAPCWVRVVKSGGTFSGYYAEDDGGQPGTWIQVGTSGTANLGSSFVTGLASTAHTTGALCTTVYDHISGEPNYTLSITPNTNVTGTSTVTVSANDGTGSSTESFVLAVNPPPQISSFDDYTVALGGTAGPLAFTVLPSADAYDPLTVTVSSSNTALVPLGDIVVSSASDPWFNMDLGQPGYTGSSLPGDIFTIVGSGSDFYNTQDQGQYIYQPATGNGEIMARVTSLQPVNVWSKAALMMRSGTAANASDVYVLVSASNGVALQYRSTTGGSAAQNAQITGIAAPCWLQLVKSGTDFTGYYAEDDNGVPGTWVEVGGTLGINLGLELLRGPRRDFARLWRPLHRDLRQCQRPSERRRQRIPDHLHRPEHNWLLRHHPHRQRRRRDRQQPLQHLHHPERRPILAHPILRHIPRFRLRRRYGQSRR